MATNEWSSENYRTLNHAKHMMEITEAAREKETEKIFKMYN